MDVRLGLMIFVQSENSKQKKKDKRKKFFHKKLSLITDCKRKINHGRRRNQTTHVQNHCCRRHWYRKNLPHHALCQQCLHDALQIHYRGRLCPENFKLEL
eukprot:Lithocolla_globosa_v1_NODE_1411_length_2599_cov_8.375786.p2 type:complete len:100 gc:universal NODE_1411_length_2599_cov_8.375786:2211-1912(-)